MSCNLRKIGFCIGSRTDLSSNDPKEPIEYLLPNGEDQRTFDILDTPIQALQCNASKSCQRKISLKGRINIRTSTRINKITFPQGPNPTFRRCSTLSLTICRLAVASIPRIIMAPLR